MNLIENIEEVNRVGEKIIEQGKKFDEVMDTMYQVIDDLKIHWTGNQADYLVFINRARKNEQSMRKTGKIIAQYGTVLKDISENTKMLSETIEQTVGRV